MKKNVILAIAALVTVGIALAGIGVAMNSGPTMPAPPIPVPPEPVSDAVCEDLADEMLALMDEQDTGVELPDKAEIIAKLRAAEDKGIDLTAINLAGDPRGGDAATSEWVAPWCPIQPNDCDTYMFTVCGQNVKAGLLWDECDNNLGLCMDTWWAFDSSDAYGTLTEETIFVDTYPYAPCSWVWVYVWHGGSSCCEVAPTCQFYMLTIDEGACCFDDCDDCGDC